MNGFNGVGGCEPSFFALRGAEATVANSLASLAPGAVMAVEVDNANIFPPKLIPEYAIPLLELEVVAITPCPALPVPLPTTWAVALLV